MVLTALTPPLLPQGARAAAAEAKAQPLAPRRELPAPRRQTATIAARASRKEAMKEAKVPKVRTRSHQRA
jgi:hypothetical protein